MEKANASARSAKIIAVGNQKGGVGKTTLTVHLARALAEKGRSRPHRRSRRKSRGNESLRIDPEAFYGAFEVMLGSEPPANVLLMNDPAEELWLPQNLHLVPCNRKIQNIDSALREQAKMRNPHTMLSGPLGALRSEYDYIFLDTAPNSNSPTIAAYKAADFFLLAAIPETFAVKGLNDALTDIDDAHQREREPAVAGRGADRG